MSNLDKEYMAALRLFNTTVSDTSDGSRTSLVKLMPVVQSSSLFLCVDEWILLLQTFDGQSNAFNEVGTVLKPIWRQICGADSVLYSDIADNQGLLKTRQAFQAISEWNRSDTSMSHVYHAGLRLLVLDRLAAACRVNADSSNAWKAPMQLFRRDESTPRDDAIIDPRTKLDPIEVFWLSGQAEWMSTVDNFISDWEMSASRRQAPLNQAPSGTQLTVARPESSAVLRLLMEESKRMTDEQRLLCVKGNICDAAIGLLAYCTASNLI